MSIGSYHQFCPVAMATEVLGSRWTILLLRELIIGSTRFNELRRGLPRMSPALLSKRLKELEQAGIVTRKRMSKGADAYEYKLTDAGSELKPIVEAVGVWGQRWVSSETTLRDVDVDLLMWDMRRNINAEPMSTGLTTIQFIYSDLPSTQRNWWLVVDAAGSVDLCKTDPGNEVDLYISTDLRTMTEIWLGLTDIGRSEADGRFILSGSKRLSSSVRKWLKLSIFANVKKQVA